MNDKCAVNKIRTFISIILLILLSGSTAVYYSNKTFKIRWAHNELQQYNYSAVNTLLISDPISGDKQTQVKQEFKGDLFIKFFEDKSSIVNAVAEFREFNQTKINTYPFEVLFKTDGQVKELVFSESIPASTQKKIKGMFDTLNFSFMPEAESWTKNESGNTGKYVAKYQKISDSVINKKILEYTELADKSGYVADVSMIKSDTSITLSKNKSWLESLKSHEEIKFTRENKSHIISFMNVEFVRNENISGQLPVWASGGYQHAKNYLKHHNLNYDIHIVQAARKEKYQEVLQNNLQKLKETLKPSEMLKTTSLIAQDLKNEPYLIDNLLKTLQQGEFAGNAGAHAIYALQKAATDRAQQGLVEIINSDLYHDYNKRRAIIALGSMSLSTESENFLWSLLVQSENSKYSESAAYALGNAAGALNQEYPERSDKIIEKLTENLETGLLNNNYNQAGIILTALGNSTRDDAAEILYPFLDAPSDLLRQTAAESLAIVKDLQATSVLAEKLLEEEIPLVRKKIIYSMNSREITAESVEAVQQAVLEEEDESVRLDMAKYLLKASKSYKGNKEVLKQTLALETNREIYNLLSQALAN